ncbi:DUF4828 domain-containing protein [Lentilactobacillus kosonis]|uniref:DUF4828 domain-containing protein n=1 Tax=Lentilactobacillus kosonis TaxID=2810561 RepID=A0A401FLB8_9LACO|nr:DUF4828 domain-containing protein [Lentilactobacillus kosonis]GAY73184.1 hypothetical protein NBRC111893_1330 [Lentilactobacillus kosonis]
MKLNLLNNLWPANKPAYKNHNQNSDQIPVSLGKYQYTDKQANTHILEINSTDNFKIDRHPLTVRMQQAIQNKLVFVDNFGYKIEIKTNAGQPVKFYDESTNSTYDLSAAY